MQAKSSVSDYHESGKLSWVPLQSAVEPGKGAKLAVVNASQHTKLKPGLY